MEPQADPPGGGFAAFPLDARILQALETLGFDEPTPIQRATVGPLLEGRDVIGRARTGSGKTAAFGLPLLEHVKGGGRSVRALLLVPTRELALQVTEALRSYAKKLPVRIVTLYGGAAYEPQLRALRDGAEIVVGTPGRVIDHITRRTLDLGRLEMLVLDEADEMLRMGFIEDVERVLEAAPDERQVALFSASMPDRIQAVAARYLKDPVEIQVETQSLTVHHIEQRWLAVPPANKIDALARILAAEPRGSTLVFVRTRKGCAEAADELARRGIAVDALHGDLNQAARERVLSRFRSQSLDVVIATDVAARGIDVEHITHVINLDMPEDIEIYTHRIGRTGRAGREGKAITFVMPRERWRIASMQRALQVKIEQMTVPSDAAIERGRRRQLENTLEESLGRGAPVALRAFLDGVLARHDPAEVAAAALQLLLEKEGKALSDFPDEQPPFWARAAATTREPRERAPFRPDGPSRPSFSEDDPASAVELFFPVGRRRGLEARHVVAALANGLGVPGAEIGRITLLETKTFVRVTQAVADRLLKEGASIELRGQQVPVVRARPSLGDGHEAGPGGPGPGRRPRPFAGRGGGAPPKRGKGPGGGRRPTGRHK